jgi:hypothetical protein
MVDRRLTAMSSHKQHLSCGLLLLCVSCLYCHDAHGFSEMFRLLGFSNLVTE